MRRMSLCLAAVVLSGMSVGSLRAETRGSAWASKRTAAIRNAEQLFYKQLGDLERERLRTLADIERRAKLMPPQRANAYIDASITKMQDKYHAMLDDLIDYYGQVLMILAEAHSEREAVARIDSIRSP